MQTISEAIKAVLDEPPKTFRKEEAHELLLHLGVIDEDGNIQEPYQEIFEKKQ